MITIRKNKNKIIKKDNNKVGTVSPLANYIKVNIISIFVNIFLYTTFIFILTKNNVKFDLNEFLYSMIEFLQKYIALFIPFMALDLTIYSLDKYNNEIRSIYIKSKVKLFINVYIGHAGISSLVFLAYTKNIFTTEQVKDFIPRINLVLIIIAGLVLIYLLICFFVHLKHKNNKQ